LRLNPGMVTVLLSHHSWAISMRRDVNPWDFTP
jgi:hypothetical protein